jgi:hypothetical protein
MYKLHFEICSLSKRIGFSEGGDIILCEKNCGKNPPKPISFLSDRAFCVATVFNPNSKHVVPETKIETERMSYCLYRELENYFF